MGNVELVQLLLARGADPNQGKTHNGATGLVIAAQEGHYEIARVRAVVVAAVSVVAMVC